MQLLETTFILKKSQETFTAFTVLKHIYKNAKSSEVIERAVVRGTGIVLKDLNKHKRVLIK